MTHTDAVAADIVEAWSRITGAVAEAEPALRAAVELAIERAVRRG